MASYFNKIQLRDSAEKWQSCIYTVYTSFHVLLMYSLWIQDSSAIYMAYSNSSQFLLTNIVMYFNQCKMYHGYLDTLSAPTGYTQTWCIRLHKRSINKRLLLILLGLTSPSHSISTNTHTLTDIHIFTDKEEAILWTVFYSDKKLHCLFSYALWPLTWYSKLMYTSLS